MVFGTYDRSVATRETVAASGYIQSAWGGFVKDPVNGLSKLGWVSYPLQLLLYSTPSD